MTNTQQQISDKTILVTGGAGFIGSNLCDNFIEHGNRVVCLDNFATGKIKNIEHHLENKNFRLIEGDIRDIDICKEAVLGADIVYHQAALGSVPRSVKDPKTTNDVNISGFLNMLIATRDAKIDRFVYACSSSTYGDSQELPKVEERIGKPLSPYAVTKLVNELYADVFAKTYKMNLIGLRYFNVFGNRQDNESTYAAVIPLFVSSLLKGNPITINGDGTFSRDFTHISNVILANNLAGLTQNQEAINQVYNVACGERTTLNQMVELLIKYLAKYQKDVVSCKIVHGQNREGDIPHSLASIDKAKKLLEYYPITLFADGLEKACEWYSREL